MDRLLRAALKPAPGETAADGVETEANCPDAGILAAFIESGLTATEQSAVEMHLAGCGRCQEALSIISDHLPEELVAEVASPESTWFTWVTRPRLRWLVPVSAAATVAVVIFATRPLIAPESDKAAPSDVMQLAQAPAPPAESPAPSGATMREKPAAVPEKSEAAATVRRDDAARSLAVLAPPPAPARDVLADAAPAGRIGLDKKSADPAAGMMAAREASEAQRTQPAAAPAAAPQLREELRRLVSVATVTAAPDGRVRWRLGPGGRIWRSTDAGSTWHWQPSDVSADLVAGSAPSATTCWAVGSRGVVLLTVDGQRWTLLPFPLSVDLAAVEASDSRIATVTTRDGRRFATLDAGHSWSPRQ